MMNYYNEFNPKAAAWLRELIKAGLIPPGDVDERSIVDVKPEELRGYTQCHFFAGIGGWSFALQLAGWTTNRPVWTGSCPCQPFSSAGKQKGKSDERHLWPVWGELIRQCKPSVVFGEQVATAITHGWLDEVFNDLEAEGYACGAAIIPACSVGAPHKRDRLWFVGDSKHNGRTSASEQRGNGTSISHGSEGQDIPFKPERTSNTSHVADAGLQRQTWEKQQSTRFEQCCQGSDVGNPEQQGLQRHTWDGSATQGREKPYRPITTSSVWGDVQFIRCPDGKARPIEPSIPLLADGVSNRVAKLHGLGNAIVPQVAAEFIKAYQGGLTI